MDNQDKTDEQRRYDHAYASILAKGNRPPIVRGSAAMPPELRSPYLCYEENIFKHIGLGSRVLEIGAGSGLHTLALLETGARVIATDISAASLKLLSTQYHSLFNNFSVELADIESLPFADSSFEFVTCAGSLSYGNPNLVFSEIQRVLRTGGTFICVDSLNNNPIYRFNRWVHYLRGVRTLSTLKNMPAIPEILKFHERFSRTEMSFFGSATFLMPLLVQLFGCERSAAFSDWVDRTINTRRSAFKFVLVASNLTK